MWLLEFKSADYSCEMPLLIQDLYDFLFYKVRFGRHVGKPSRIGESALY